MRSKFNDFSERYDRRLDWLDKNGHPVLAFIMFVVPFVVVAAFIVVTGVLLFMLIANTKPLVWLAALVGYVVYLYVRALYASSGVE